MFINNKYKTWHDNIITKAKNRTLEGYKEIHHILPRCLGGKDRSYITAEYRELHKRLTTARYKKVA